MTFVLDCTTPLRKTRWLLRSGERARIGSSPWIEFCIEDDETIAAEHLSASYTDRMTLQAIGDSQLKVDNKLVASACISDRTLVGIGQCEILFQPAFARERTTIPAEVAQEVLGPAKVRWPSKAEVLECVGMSIHGMDVIAQAVEPRAAINLLNDQNLAEDAIRLIAGCLPVNSVIYWCFTALVKHKIISGEKLLPQMREWIAEPNEKLRCEIASGIEWSNNASPWTWILAAVSWTGGSLGQASSPSVPPPQKMIVSAIIASLQLASCQTNRKSFCDYCIREGLKLLPTTHGEET